MDLYFLLFTAFGVLVFGLSKGGFPGPIAMVAVPVMSIVMSPIQAAAILLPILLIMDFIAIYIYWNKWKKELLKIILPASIIGIVIGSLTFQYTSENKIRIIVGTISILFVLISLLQKKNFLLKPTNSKGYFWSSIAGYTSFLIHAGGPPINFYLLPLRMKKITYLGTITLSFLIINLVKLIPYYKLNLLETSNLKISAFFLPLAIISVFIGFLLQKKIPEKLFYNIIYILLFISGLKLIIDAI